MILQYRQLSGLFFLIVVGIIVLDYIMVPSNALGRLPAPGTVIPAFSIPVPTKNTDRAYLNIGKGDNFQPGSISAELVFIEVFSVYCASCRLQAPYLNELYTKIQKDPELKNHVKMIGIGAGNDKRDISDHEGKYSFPIFPDEDFKFHELVGEPATPFMIFARPYGNGRLFVVDTHLGTLEDSNKLLSKVRKAYRADLSKMKVVLERERSPSVEEDLVIPISEDELMKKLRQSLSGLGEEPSSIQKISLNDLGTVYMGTLAKLRKRVFARVVARRIPCVDCHDIFFVYSFDDKGDFLNFIPIEITKLDNEDWDTSDISKIQNHFTGKSLLAPHPFNPKVDAVTTATISSKLVFDSLGKTDQIYEKLIELGYIFPP